MQGIIKKLKNRTPGISGGFPSKPFAVLLPVVEKEDRAHILFEVRAAGLNRQPGEICFPGGRVEKHEEHQPDLAALRETSEELGVAITDIEIIGQLDIIADTSGSLVYPYSGLVRAESFTPNPMEVKEVFLVPVDFFLHTPPVKTHVEVAYRYSKDFPVNKVPPIYKGGWVSRFSFPTFHYQYGDYFIWGLTGRILFNFLSACWPDHDYFV